MHVLVINCGSSSIKYGLYEMPGQHQRARGIVDRVGSPLSLLRHHAGGQDLQRELHVDRIATGVQVIADLLRHALADPTIDAVGHRVVHGADQFRHATVIDDAVLDAIEQYASLAPLHNPANAEGIRAGRLHFQNATHVAVFDTAFFHTLDPKAYLYAVPKDWHQKYGIRRYGFHGTSHRYVSERAAAILNLDRPNLITMHLGNGCSMACVKEGLAIDTTMGFTPLEGLVMGTRSGDIDPGAILHLLDQGLAPDEIRTGLQHQGGLLGASGISHDVRDLLSTQFVAASEAISLFVHRVRKYLGSFLVQLERCDALVFTGGIGENAPALRAQICWRLDRFGICLDDYANHRPNADERSVHAPDSSVRILVIPTNEELAIAKETADLLR